MKLQHILFTIAFAAISALSFSQSGYLGKISIEDYRLVKEDNGLSVSMNIVLDELKIKSNDVIVLTPVLQANGGGEISQLPPVVVAGNRRMKVLERQKRLHNGDYTLLQPQTVVTRKNGTAQQIGYTAQLPLQPWMKNASLVLQETITGCAGCDRGNDRLVAVARILKEPYLPAYKLAYLMPEVQPLRKEGELSGTVNFIVDKSKILRNYRENTNTLERVDEFIGEIKSLKDAEITRFTITGYASPEASVPYNKALAERRADALAGYISAKHGIDRNTMRVTGYGEDWSMLREQVAASSLTHKNEILAVIDDVSNPDARDAELKKLSGGSVYRELLRNYYPDIRRTEYTIAYEQGAAFDPVKAGQTLRTRPGDLSIAEFHLLAQTYTAGTPEFKDLYRKAAELYPDDVPAAFNAAVADLEEGKESEAMERLEKVKADPRVWNILGVANARRGDLQTAGEYFQKAATNGDADAKANLEEVQKVQKDNE